jgi:hypothetical protein
MTNNILKELKETLANNYPDFDKLKFYDEKKWFEKLTNKRFREVRRRLHFYTNLELLASRITIFDVMNQETFKILLHAKRIAKYYNFEEVTEEILILAFLSGKKPIHKLFKKAKVNKEAIYQEFLTKYPLPKRNIFQKIGEFISERIFFEKKVSLDKKFNFSTGCLDVCFKASENTFERFKTFVITPEILLITLLETKNPLFMKGLEDKKKWYILRYILLRRINTEELLIQTKVKTNQFLYIYLLKSRLPQRTYQFYLGGKRRKILYLAFRSLLFSHVLNWDRLKFLESQTRRSIRINSVLHYSKSSDSKKQRQILYKGKKQILQKIKQKFETIVELQTKNEKIEDN